jgi:Flp pilus assembly pilin Flp
MSHPFNSTRRRRRRGQGMTEYIIMVGLVAIVMIPALGSFRDALAGSFDEAGKSITEKVTNQMPSKKGGSSSTSSRRATGPR